MSKLNLKSWTRNSKIITQNLIINVLITLVYKCTKFHEGRYFLANFLVLIPGPQNCFLLFLSFGDLFLWEFSLSVHETHHLFCLYHQIFCSVIRKRCHTLRKIAYMIINLPFGFFTWRWVLYHFQSNSSKLYFYNGTKYMVFLKLSEFFTL